MRWQAVIVILLILGFALTPGCVDGTEPDGDGAEDEDGASDTYEDCDGITLSQQINGTTWHAGHISCDANVSGTDRQTVPCGSPEEAEATYATELSSEELRILVLDGDEETVVDRRVTDTGGESEQLALTDGRSGDWTLVTERPDGFQGEFDVELACPE